MYCKCSRLFPTLRHSPCSAAAAARCPSPPRRFREQSLRFGTQIFTETVNKVDLSRRPLKFWTDEKEVTAQTLIIATGAVAKRLPFKGSDEDGGFWNKGISACAVCDGAAPIFRNKPIAVIGGGDSAMEEALFLTKYGSEVRPAWGGWVGACHGAQLHAGQGRRRTAPAWQAAAAAMCCIRCQACRGLQTKAATAYFKEKQMLVKHDANYVLHKLLALT